jgi:spermidine export protein MdtJ
MAESVPHRRAGGKDQRLSRRGVQAWCALLLAIALDVAQVFALDASAGFTSSLLATAAIMAFVAELVLFTLALRHVPPTNAYALLGLSTAAVSIISIGWLGEQITIIKALALCAVIAGATLLNSDARAAPRRKRTD